MRLEKGWLATDAARGADAGTIEEWMEGSHRVGSQVWPWLGADNFVNDEYYGKAVPVVDRQLSLAGIRLARFLNETLPAKHQREKCS